MFGGLRQNNLFYILEKGDNLNLKIGQVVSVSNPQPKQGQYTAIHPYGQQELFVDVKVKVGEDIMELKQLNSNLNIANSGNLVVSDNRESMNSEIECMLRNSQQIIDSIPYHESIIKNCDSIMRELNPQFAKEKEQEEKIDALEERMGNIDDKLNKMFELLSDTVGHNKTKIKKEE